MVDETELIMLTTLDVRHVCKMVLQDNKGQVITEALGIGLEEAIVFYCQRIHDDAQRAIQLAEKENG